MELPDLSQLTNDPIFHNPIEPSVPTNIPSNILKFNGNLGEDLAAHITAYHLWCVPNSILDDSI